MKNFDIYHRMRWGLLRCVVVAALFSVMLNASAAQSTAPADADAQFRQAMKNYPGLFPEFARLLEKMQREIQFPPPRQQSRLMPLLPSSTIFYAAFPNYGDASQQGLKIFQRELQQNPDLRAWWQSGDMAAQGPKLEAAIEQFYQFSQYLGDEIVISVAPEESKEPNFLILAEVEKPGVKEFLQRFTNDLGSKSQPARVLDVRELATAKDTFPAPPLIILVRPDLVVAAPNLAVLRTFNARLERGQKDFASTPFGRRLAQTYDGSTTVMGAFDLRKLLRQLPTDQSQTLQRTGFADVKYLVWQHKNMASEMELSFTGPRHGVASWLAAPGTMGSLDFVSPQATFAMGMRLKNPAEIFDDIKDLSNASNPQSFASVTQMEAAMGLSIREDLLSLLSGEITLELDSLTPPQPAWRAILQVKDPLRLQATLSKLLAGAPLGAQQFNEGGVTYHTLQMPSARQTMEIAYAFVDGYLIIGSGRSSVAESVRLHRTGESLSKSKKFLASLPPGRLKVFSGVFYEDPVAIAAMTLQRISPAMKDTFLQAGSQSSPVVICAYGESSSLREASNGGAADAGAMMVVAAIAIPNLLRARIAANEASAVASVRMANTAQITYSAVYPQRGFARELAALGPDPSGANTVSFGHAGLLDATLGNATCTADSWCTKSGFQFRVAGVCGKQHCDDYVVMGIPIDKNSGLRSFCSTSDGVVRFQYGSAAPSSLSVAECQQWAPLQ